MTISSIYRYALGLLLAVLVVVPNASQSQQGPDGMSYQAGIEKNRADAKQAAEAELSSRRTLLELVQLVGLVPDGCQDLSPETRVCSWEVSNRRPGYDVLAATLGTSARVYLVCELPQDNSERADGSCTVSAPH